MGPPGKGILKTQIPSFPRPVSEIQLPLAPHDCWDKDLGLVHREQSGDTGPAARCGQSLPAWALPHSHVTPYLCPACPMLSPSSPHPLLSKAATSLRSLSTHCFSAVVDYKAVLFSERVSELEETLVLSCSHFAEEKSKTQRRAVTYLRSQV